MLQSIKQILRNRDNDAGIGEAVANRKIMQSQKTGKKYVLPGHVSDFMEQNAVVKTEFNPDRYASNDWNWRRKLIKKSSRKTVCLQGTEFQKNREYGVE